MRLDDEEEQEEEFVGGDGCIDAYKWVDVSGGMCAEGVLDCERC